MSPFGMGRPVPIGNRTQEHRFTAALLSMQGPEVKIAGWPTRRSVWCCFPQTPWSATNLRRGGKRAIGPSCTGHHEPEEKIFSNSEVRLLTSGAIDGFGHSGDLFGRNEILHVEPVADGVFVALRIRETGTFRRILQLCGMRMIVPRPYGWFHLARRKQTPSRCKQEAGPGARAS